MRTGLAVVLVYVVAVILLATPAEAHSSGWRGPNGAIAPTGRVPTDPGGPPPDPGSGAVSSARPLLPGGGPAPGPVGGATPSGGGGGGSTPGAGPARPGVGVPTAPRGAAGRRRKSSSGFDGYESWEFWWSFNQWRFLDLRSSDRFGHGSTEGLDYLLGRADPANVSDVTRPTDRYVADQMLPALTEAAKDPFFDVRASAVLAIGKTREDSALPVLLAGLGDEHRQVRYSSALALGLLAQPEGIAPLRHVLLATDAGKRLASRDRIGARTRAFAAVSLGLIGYAGVGDRQEIGGALILGLRNTDRNAPEIPICSAIGLGIMRHAPAVPFLMALFRDPKTPELLRAHVLNTLGKIGDPAALPLARSALRDRSIHVQRSGILALGLLAGRNDERTAALLRSWAVRGRDAQGKCWAMISLARTAGPEMRPLFRKLVREKTGNTRSFAALGLALLSRRFPDPGDGELVLEQFRSERDPRAQGGLAIALGLLGHASAHRDLERVFSEKGDSDRSKGYCAVALGLLGARDSIPAIKDVLRRRIDPDLKRLLAMALGLMGDRDVVPLLMSGLTGGSSIYEVIGSASALGFVGDVSCVEPLIRIVKDRGRALDMVRTSATMALGFVGDPRPRPLLHLVSRDFNYRALVASVNDLILIL